MIDDNTVHKISEEKPLTAPDFPLTGHKVVRHPSNKQMPDNKGYYLDIHHDACLSCEKLSDTNLRSELQKKENEKLSREIILLKRELEKLQEKQSRIETENTSLQLRLFAEDAATKNFRESIPARQNYKNPNGAGSDLKKAKKWAEIFFFESESMLIVALVFLLAIIIFGMPAVGKLLQSLF